MLPNNLNLSLGETTGYNRKTLGGNIDLNIGI